MTVVLECKLMFYWEIVWCNNYVCIGVSEILIKTIVNGMYVFVTKISSSVLLIQSYAQEKHHLQPPFLKVKYNSCISPILVNFFITINVELAGSIILL